MNEEHPLTQAIIAGRRKEVAALVNQCLAAGEKAGDIVEKRLVPGMMAVGEKFKRNEIFVPEMLIAARAMKEALKTLEPQLIAAGVRPEHSAVIGTVEGDLHDIGKNLVAMMWKGANIEVIDLGVNVTPAQFVEAVKQHKPKLVGLSALLTTTMPAMRDIVKAIRDAGLAVKVVIGGAPITQEFATAIGADAYAPDAGSAVDTEMALLQGKA
jgi:5-methyltetrahydrofolate--homocysteine methyltransferase